MLFLDNRWDCYFKSAGKDIEYEIVKQMKIVIDSKGWQQVMEHLFWISNISTLRIKKLRARVTQISLSGTQVMFFPQKSIL